MATIWPGSIDTFIQQEDDVDFAEAADINPLYDAVTELETELQALASNPRKIVIFEAAAPVRWTIDATNNDAVLRVVSGTGGGTGGTDSISSPPTHVHGGNAHTHPFTTGGPSATFLRGDPAGSAAVPTDLHTHSGTSGSGGGGNTGPTVGFNPKFINMIVITKDA